MRHRKSCPSSSAVGALNEVTVAALRIHAGHDVADRAVLPARVERLQHDEQRVLLFGVQQILQDLASLA